MDSPALDDLSCLPRRPHSPPKHYHQPPSLQPLRLQSSKDQKNPSMALQPDIKVDPSRNLGSASTLGNLRWRGGAACLLFSTSMVEDFATWLQIHLALIGIVEGSPELRLCYSLVNYRLAGASTSMSTRRLR
ncbi:hypothetical protein Pint_07210 [Pistacia integerrima]|uniref:Uncharacterized protein n=1 Tax=Pistacia integerrima TaxID=434235 RepID=A0ACC0XWN8_9ROSI|nr:hypothetical protein Pint_07210 [Pistacia integerrima]